MKKRILLLTNIKNGDTEEDLFLSDCLKKHFNVIISHPLESKRYADDIDLVLIRNIWPTKDYDTELFKVLNYFDKKGIKIYNPLTSKGDMYGKDYLVELFNKGYPVIPTIKNKSELTRLGIAEAYFVKPLKGGSSFGCKKLNKRELLNFDTANYIIQPFTDIEREISFYFIDNEFQHALYTQDKNKRWDLKQFNPTKQEIYFANQFVKWNNIKKGLQRIDICKTRDGKLLLIEIEDLCPYLSLLDLHLNLRNKFLKNLVKSLKKLTYSKGTKII